MESGARPSSAGHGPRPPRSRGGGAETDTGRLAASDHRDGARGASHVNWSWRIEGHSHSHYSRNTGKGKEKSNSQSDSHNAEAAKSKDEDEDEI